MNSKTWVEIKAENLRHNVGQFRARIGEGVKIAGVLKSNAYGHGLEQVAEVIQSEVDWIAVDSINEALILKERGVGNQILILGYTLEENLSLVVENNFHQVIANFETLEVVSREGARLNKTTHVHLKIETGTSRQGILIEELDQYLTLIKTSDNLELAGVSTHFSNIEDTTDHSYAEFQLANYKKALSVIDNAGFSGYIKHTACSAAAVLFEETYFDMIRLGISLYGMWSSSETLVSAKQKDINIDLKPALTWKSKIAHIKDLPAGTCVSYGCTERLVQDTKTAVLPIGYWDGFDRGLSSVGNVLIGGHRCRVIGRVCMNMIVVDVTQVSGVKLEDEVIILGEQEKEFISAEEIAQKIGTINYEVTTRINPLMPRKLI